MYYIYKIQSKINNKIYIGKTNNFKIRKWQHIHLLKKNDHHNKHLQNHFNKHIAIKSFEEVFSFDIIETCSTLEDSNNLEIYWINYYKSKNKNLLFNLTEGGDSVVLVQEVEKKRIETIRNKQSPIFMYDLYGNFIKKYRCIQDAAEELNIVNSRISASIRKKQRCGKYIFNKEKISFEMYSSSNEVVVYVYTIEGIFIGKYRSIASAARELNLNKNAVSNAFNREIRYKNYLFFKNKKQFEKYIPNRTGKIVYINVYDTNNNIIDTVKGLKECAKKYNINYNTLNTYCRRKTIVNNTYIFEKIY